MVPVLHSATTNTGSRRDMQKERGEEDKTKTKESEMVKRRIREVIANKSRA